jgi:sarcosine oxidase subunit gamma
MANTNAIEMLSDHSGPIKLLQLPEEVRFSLRIDVSLIAKASKALGFKLPDQIGARTNVETGYAAMLGPDEWVIKTSAEDRDSIASAFTKLYKTTPHSLTDISDREISILLEGSEVTDLLAIGNPLDFRKFKVGRSERTLFDTAQIVLHRDRDDSFKLDVWRSFFPHVWGMLVVGNRELAVKI